MHKFAAFIILATLAMPAGAADVYKCTDADGKVYYSGQKCPSSDEGSKLRVQRPSAPRDETDDDNAGGKSLDERIAEAEDPLEKARLELRKQQCDVAREQLERYEDAPYLVERMDDGSERRLSDEEAAAEKARLRTQITEQCR